MQLRRFQEKLGDIYRSLQMLLKSLIGKLIPGEEEKAVVRVAILLRGVEVTYRLTQDTELDTDPHVESGISHSLIDMATVQGKTITLRSLVEANIRVIPDMGRRMVEDVKVWPA